MPFPSVHAVATSVGAASGGITGAAIGHSIVGKVSAAVGGVAGGVAGNAIAPALQSNIAEFIEKVLQETSPSLGLGADTKAIELPAHYSWEELQALSQPQPEAI